MNLSILEGSPILDFSLSQKQIMRHALSLGVPKDGQPTIDMMSKSSNNRITIGFNNDPVLYMSDDKNNPRIIMKVDNQNNPTLRMFNQQGDTSFQAPAQAVQD